MTLVVAFELSFNIRKKIEKIKVSGEVNFALISLFYVQIQKPTSRLTTKRPFVLLAKVAGFYYHKIFKQDVDNDLSVCLDECGLYITGEIDIYLFQVIRR